VADLTPTLERARERFPAPELPIEAITEAVARRQRTRRIAATALGLAITVAVVAGGTAILRSSPPPAQPAPSPTSIDDPSPGPTGPSLEPAPADNLPPLLRSGEVLRTRQMSSGADGTVVAVDASGAERDLAPCEDPCIMTYRPEVSPDGRWLAYEVLTCVGSRRCEDEAGLWVTNALGARTQLTQACDPAACPRMWPWAWLPSGAALAIAAGDHVLLIDLIAGEGWSLDADTIAASLFGG